MPAQAGIRTVARIERSEIRGLHPACRFAHAGYCCYAANDSAAALNPSYGPHRFTFQTANQPAKRHHPYSLRRRVRRSPLWSLALPLKNMRGWRAKWLNHCSFVPRSLSRTRSASRRATQTSLRKSGVICGRLPYCAGPRFAGAVQSGLPSSPPGLPSFPTASPAEPRAGLNGRRQPSSWQAALQWPPGGAPAPPGCVPCEARPRAPHPAPSPRRL